MTAGSEPVEAAHVRLIALKTGTVPLPVTLENLEKYLYAVEAAGATDERGEVRLTLHRGSPHVVEVGSPPLGPLADEGPWAWRLDEAGAELRPVRLSSGVEAAAKAQPRPIELTVER